ncbi:acyltransferase family protein [Paenibacillus puerhi]|uniref:acyltransferase family protein n=1 Tax=Paenibacillus puerhi TaxID=2692622 RepID=UPI001357809B|nr:acyltransferase family protein [Paenibacillus puerhi]
MNKNSVNEIFLLRSLACLAIVFLHAITFSKYDSLTLPDSMSAVLESSQMLLMFGTPMFVFISEFLLSYSYPNRLPAGFFTKRLKFIAIPFLMMALIYALFFALANYRGNIPGAFLTQSVRNIFLADFHGYFILIIFQFYVLHGLFQKFRMERVSAKVMIPIALGINLAYLGLFNFSEPLFTEYYWKRLFPLAFPAWLAYFTVAYYCGRNYEKFKAICASYRYVWLVLVIGFAGIMLYFNNSAIIDAVHSKRIDVLFYTLGMIMLLFGLASRLKRVPAPLLVVSNYSFAIYWIHISIQIYVMPYLITPATPASVLLFIPTAFVIGLLGSLGIAYLLSKSTLGVYLIGRTGASASRSRRLDIGQTATLPKSTP